MANDQVLEASTSPVIGSLSARGLTFWRSLWGDNALDQQQRSARIWASHMIALAVALVGLVLLLQNVLAGRAPWALVPGFPDVFTVFILGYLLAWWLYQRSQYKPWIMVGFLIFACGAGVISGLFINGVAAVGTGLLIVVVARLTLPRAWAWLVTLEWLLASCIGLVLFVGSEQGVGLRVVLATLIVFLMLDQFIAAAHRPTEERCRRTIAVAPLGLAISVVIILLLAWSLGARANLWVNLLSFSLIGFWVWQRQLFKHLWAMQGFAFLGGILGLAAVWVVGLPSIPFSFVAFSVVAVVFRPVPFILMACVTFGLDIYTLTALNDPAFEALFQRLGVGILMLLPILALSLSAFLNPSESLVYQAMQRPRWRRLVGRYVIVLLLLCLVALGPLLMSQGESPMLTFITSAAGWYWLYSALLLVLLVAILLALRGQRQRALRKALVSAEKSNAIQSQFLRSMNHDMRNPLNGFMGTLQNLQREAELSPQTQQYLSVMAGSAMRLKHLLSDITDIGAIERQELTLQVNAFELAGQLQQQLQLQAQNAAQQDVKLYRNISLPSPCWVLGDALRVGQILDNLVGNAIKFSPGAEVFVTLGYRDERLHLQVRDTGIGMDEATLARVFDRFAQADGSNTRKFQGLGLGLAITQQLVDLMQGELHCQSTLGEGSEFSVSLALPRVSHD